MSSKIKDYLLLLYIRPQEPLFLPKGEKNTVFKLPIKFLAERYQRIGGKLEELFTKSAGEQVVIKDIPLPDLGGITSLGRYENFSLFIPKHIKLSTKLINILLGYTNIEDFLAVACFARDNVNPYMFSYCLTICILNRTDTRDLRIPSNVQSFPDRYVDSSVFARLREESLVVPVELRKPFEIPQEYTASLLDEEQRVAYFREDIGINLHHWHWHVVYPGEGNKKIVDKNRRGELFYYMHRQIISRYNVERLCNHLGKVVPITNLREPLKEAYFPKIDSLVANRSYPARAPHQKLSDLDRSGYELKQYISDMERWRNRIYDAIHQGYIQDVDGNKINLTEDEGIDILGNMVEPSILSPNRTFYGNYHNMGHNFISLIHDPNGKYLEDFGVMADTTTAMRDPVFYRWHANIDDIFQEFKHTLPPYSTEQLEYQGVTVTKIEVQSQDSAPNILHTFWQKSDVDLSGGIDFRAQGPVFVRFTHLQHRPFKYSIRTNNQGSNKMGTCRIFLAPKFDENNYSWLYRDQQHLFIELDKFTVNLKTGENTITRSSTQSSVTIPFEQTFASSNTGGASEGETAAEYNMCGCGWPEHMLIPKGTEKGYTCQLFVMISDYSYDNVHQDNTGIPNESFSYCGLKNRLYPDRRSMGYPFDRNPRIGVHTLQEFLTQNMAVQDVVIQFNNTTVGPERS